MFDNIGNTTEHHLLLIQLLKSSGSPLGFMTWWVVGTEYVHHFIYLLCLYESSVWEWAYQTTT